MSSVSVRNLFHDYGGPPILERVNLEIDDGSFCAILGASGCGKSTFLRLLLAQEIPVRGEIRIGDSPPATEPGPDRGVVFQRYSLFPHLTAMENLMLARAFEGAPLLGRLIGRARAEAREEARAVLKRIGLEHAADRYPAQLSGGMQQRLAIGQTLMKRPRVLLLDEPFGALDPGTRVSMHAFLLDLWHETGMTIFMVTHDLEEGFKLATRVLVFDKVRRDEHAPDAWGATVTYDLPLTRKSGARPPGEVTAAVYRPDSAYAEGGPT